MSGGFVTWLAERNARGLFDLNSTRSHIYPWRVRVRRTLCTIVAASVWAMAGAHAQVARPSQPEPASGRIEKTLAQAREYMVAAAHPLAVDAGLRMLDLGGSATDAAIATQLVLNLVEPHASGMGGGAFLVHYEAGANAMHAYDGRETAPAGADEKLFLGTDGRPMGFADAVRGGRPVGVPGLLRMLEVAHRRHGKLPWAQLFQPAIELAESGYPMSPRVHHLLGRVSGLDHDPDARRLFFDDEGRPKAPGTQLRNPAFAATLRTIARDGAAAFYSGEIARDIVAAVRGHAANPGTLSETDLASYSVREVTPLCRPYRAYRICGMPPSSSGGIAVLQILGILSHFDMAAVRPSSTEAAHLLSEAARLAFADRNRYVADDRFVDVPVEGLLDRDYLRGRAQLIRSEKSMGRAVAGTPPGVRTAYADDAHDEVAGTSHIAIVDRAGNAVSMTTTIESFFGARIMARGFLLNNQLTDFNFAPAQDGRPVANRVEPGKRPRSSMAPTLVFDAGGKLHMIVGSPGGSLIIGYVAKALVGTLDWKLDIQAAIDLPNMTSRNDATELERGTEAETLQAALAAMGHPVRLIDMTSGIHGIVRTKDGWSGGADPRREGIAKGR